MANILNNPSYGEGHQVILKPKLNSKLTTDLKKLGYVAGKSIFTITKKKVSPSQEYTLSKAPTSITFIDEKKRIFKVYGTGASFNSTFNHVGKEGSSKANTNKLTEIKELTTLYIFEAFLKNNGKLVGFEYIQKKLPTTLQKLNREEFVDSAKKQLDIFVKAEKNRFKGNFDYERQMGNRTKGMYNNVNKLTNLQKDNWNPGDIWLIRQGFKMEKYEKAESIQAINEMLIKDYKDKNLVGISLKQINPKQNGRIDYINLTREKSKESTFDFSFTNNDFTGKTFKNSIIYSQSGFGVRMGFKASTENYGVYLEGRFKGAGSQVGGIDAKRIPEEMLKRYRYTIRKGGTPDLAKEQPIALEEMRKMFKRHGANKMSNDLKSYDDFLKRYKAAPAFQKGRLCRISSFMYPYLELSFAKGGDKEFKDLMNWSYHLAKKESKLGGFYIFLGP